IGVRIRIMGSLVIIMQLGGAVALLLFGLGLVRDGLTGAFGMKLKRALRKGTGTGPRAFAMGLLATLGLQSSTATALLTAEFAEQKLIPASRAQLALIGANVGTALTAWAVAFGLEALSPLCLLAGVLLRQRAGARANGIGLALIGIGLMLLSLDLLKLATAPLQHSPAFAAFLRLLDGAEPVAFLFLAGIAMLCSSSLAAVMLVLSLEHGGGIDGDLIVAMVLGANFGGAIGPVLATPGASAVARQVTAGNLLVRSAGCAIALPLAEPVAAALGQLPHFGGGLAVETHLLFNLALALLAGPFAAQLSGLSSRLAPARDTPGQHRPRWLDEADLSTPALALAGASREALATGDIVEQMLALVERAFHGNDPGPLAQVHALDDRVDRAQHEIKVYLSRMKGDADEEAGIRAIDILDYVINLEHMGDIIDKGLARQVEKKIARGLHFSDQGYGELDQMFLLTRENLRLSQSIFINGDFGLARRLMHSKVAVRRLERQSANRHLERLRTGQTESLQTSSLHLDILRDLKQVNAHAISVAHPILDREGLLSESRLRDEGKTQAAG
nr:Na/Pi cotransporter family protein [Paracoccus sp. (in: a-proteobacteria)]